MSKQIKAFAGSATLPYCGQLSHTSLLTRQPFLTTLQADHVVCGQWSLTWVRVLEFWRSINALWLRPASLTRSHLWSPLCRWRVDPSLYATRIAHSLHPPSCARAPSVCVALSEDVIVSYTISSQCDDDHIWRIVTSALAAQQV